MKLLIIIHLLIFICAFSVSAVECYIDSDCGNECLICENFQCIATPAGTKCSSDNNECTIDECVGSVCEHTNYPPHTTCTTDGKDCTVDECGTNTETGKFECIHYRQYGTSPCPNGRPCYICDGLSDYCVAGNEGQICSPLEIDTAGTDRACIESKCDRGVCGSRNARNFQPCNLNCNICLDGHCTEGSYTQCGPAGVKDGCGDNQLCYEGPVYQIVGYPPISSIPSENLIDVRKCFCGEFSPVQVPEFQTWAFALIILIAVAVFYFFIKPKRKSSK